MPPATSGPPSAPAFIQEIEAYLSLLACPDTAQSLRWATDEECHKQNPPVTPPALARQDGTRLFPISDGIPVLLPESQ
jgi:uncharacterized protein YbaR (Trm112 family)